ncbi:MAG: hypothetical protein COA75_01565 [Cellvibrionales bacterium]|nr:MAG: hypothetical protein COA75_01565 [Cellvibrionales bacterium]
MNLLFMAGYYPMADRNSGDFRLSQLLRIFAEGNKIFFFANNLQGQIGDIGREAVDKYRDNLSTIGITVLEGGAHHAITHTHYDSVFFEWYFPAKLLINEVRLLQPTALLVIDSVDIVFNRYEAKARLSGTEEDRLNAVQIKKIELATYKASDLVITISDADAAILHCELPLTPTYTISNIHPMPVLNQTKPAPDIQLLFIGSFTHEPNVDAILYFCSEILPLVQREAPNINLYIVGNAPTEEVLALASGHIKVLGYVPETKPYLESAQISIAPLRFGGGVKGKVGEAMSYALPIVTTSTGAEGFDVINGEHLLICDDSQSFAKGVIDLLNDDRYRIRIGQAARKFIEDNYSDTVAQNRAKTLLSDLHSYKVNKLRISHKLKMIAVNFLRKNITWRFK